MSEKPSQPERLKEPERTVRRFYKQAGIGPAEGGVQGYALLLDGRRARTPAKAPFQVPSEPLAEAIAAEWEAQEDRIRPETMPLTQFAGTAIDKVAPGMEQVRGETLAYAGTDLLCYRADVPAELVEHQARTWQPVLDWLALECDAPLHATDAIIAIEQPPESLASLDRHLAAMDLFQLTAVASLTGALGSLALAMAVIRKRLQPRDAWEAAFLDELWQAGRWGDDHEASVRRQAVLFDVEGAARFFELSSA